MPLYSRGPVDIPPSHCYAGGLGGATNDLSCFTLPAYTPALPTRQAGTPSSLGGEGCSSSLGAASTLHGAKDGRRVAPALTPLSGLAARSGVPAESCLHSRGTSSGQAEVLPPRRRPQSSHPARDQKKKKEEEMRAESPDSRAKWPGFESQLCR